MSYFESTGTLVSRRGYGGPTPTGLGGIVDSITDAAASFFGGAAAPAQPSFKGGSIDSRSPAQIAADTRAANAAYAAQQSSGPSTLDKIGSFLSDGVKAAVNIYSSQQQQPAQPQPGFFQGPGPMGAPSWLVPVALLGGAGLLAVVLLKKKRKNPARGRRRHHVRRRRHARRHR